MRRPVRRFLKLIGRSAEEPGVHRLVVILALAWLAGFELHNTVLAGLPDVLFGKFASQVVLASAGLLTLAAALRRRSTAWLLIAVGMLAWTGGDLYWTFILYDLESIPVPSPADAGYLLAVPLLFAGFVLLARERLEDVPRTLWIDGLIAALAAAAASAAAVVGRVTDGVDGSVGEVLTNLAYPIGDLALLAVVIGVLALARWRLRRDWALLGLGVLLFWATDSLYLLTNANGTYESGGWFDAGWTAAFLLWALAAWTRIAAPGAIVREHETVADLRSVVVPMLFALVSLSLLGYGAVTSIDPLAGTLATLSMLAVLVRLMLAYLLNADLLRLSRHDAASDALTGLGNRRRLTADLTAACRRATPEEPYVLALFDLDGFKHYNDSFGHPAGDALLARLGAALGRVVEGRGRAYRMGGDEFCALLEARDDAPERLAALTAQALVARGEGFTIGCSFGVVSIPAEVRDAEEALRVADHRMYAQKHGGRVPVGRQSTDVLLRVITERDPGLEGHTRKVAELVRRVAEHLGLRGDDVRDVVHAAELHDIGKVAVPEEILAKPGALDVSEWAFMRRHTIIGERIVGAAPALGGVAKLVRASHERIDGRGYPDGLAGDEIPLGARIVAVCDAFDAMTTDRPYRAALPVLNALAELRRAAGSQFDPAVAEAFIRVRGEVDVGQESGVAVQHAVPA